MGYANRCEHAYKYNCEQYYYYYGRSSLFLRTFSICWNFIFCSPRLLSQILRTCTLRASAFSFASPKKIIVGVKSQMFVFDHTMSAMHRLQQDNKQNKSYTICDVAQKDANELQITIICNNNRQQYEPIPDHVYDSLCCVKLSN